VDACVKKIGSEICAGTDGLRAKDLGVRATNLDNIEGGSGRVAKSCKSVKGSHPEGGFPDQVTSVSH